MEKFNKRCVALYSGGLDSLLAIIVIKNLGFEVLPLFVKTPFYNKNEKDLKKQLAPLDLELFTIEDTEGYLEILKNPRFGYGKNLNPCIDCKIFFLKKAKEFMEETGASFVNHRGCPRAETDESALIYSVEDNRKTCKP